MILGLCDRFGCLPSQLRGESTALLRMVAVEHAAEAGAEKVVSGG